MKTIEQKLTPPPFKLVSVETVN